MPIVNYADAWGHILIKYQTPYEVHARKLYCKELDALGDWAVPPAGETNVADTILNYHNAAVEWRVAGEELLSIEFFQNSHSAAPDTYIGSVPVPAGINPGTVSPTAAAYLMLVIKSASRQLSKHVFLDAGDAKPQRYAFGELSVSQQGFVNYLIGHEALTTIDGETFTTFSSGNSGYNRRLAKRYGRVLAP